MGNGKKVRSIRQSVSTAHKRIRSNAAGRLALQIVIAAVGFTVIVVGAILIPFVGPGWAIVLTGLAILALEFPWARKALEFAKKQLKRWWSWVKRQNVTVRLLIGLAGMLFVGGVVYLSVWLSLGIGYQEMWNFLAK